MGEGGGSSLGGLRPPPSIFVNSAPTCWALPVGRAVGIYRNHPQAVGRWGEVERGSWTGGPYSKCCGARGERSGPAELSRGKPFPAPGPLKQRHFRGLTASNCNRKQSGKIIRYQRTGSTPDQRRNRGQSRQWCRKGASSSFHFGIGLPH